MVLSASEFTNDVPFNKKISTFWQRSRTVARGHSPYTLGKGERAFLLVHGIAGSPAQMRKLAEFLDQLGFTARAMLLPGHGTHPDDLEGVVWQDWYEAVHDEFCELRKRHQEVSLAGFSIGAALSAHYAAHNPVDRLILLSLPLCPLNDRFPTDLMLRIYWAFFKQVKGNPEAITGADGEPFYFVYERVPTAILHTMSELIRIVKHRLDRVTAPTLLIQSKCDRISGAKSGPLAFRQIGSDQKRLVMLERSGHNVILDDDQPQVFQEIRKFMSVPRADVSGKLL
ncbi:MAG: alpha/beta fold hydrolase [Candidatus Abyssobacteria bacterium SURF_5]|uniref:Alpha/beta fold hydrolase n=1 Tax=Abyssobacteria bacterium (strain SURF_5) TaxID=2093360 RepID=A0A3A4N585_ABYX5|nr:MAG: alpha/beta fold hydrolase [Candidatus Abyssubacteria bacterium SURF_5]